MVTAGENIHCRNPRYGSFRYVRQLGDRLRTTKGLLLARALQQNLGPALKSEEFDASATLRAGFSRFDITLIASFRLPNREAYFRRPRGTPGSRAKTPGERLAAAERQSHETASRNHRRVGDSPRFRVVQSVFCPSQRRQQRRRQRRRRLRRRQRQRQRQSRQQQRQQNGNGNGNATAPAATASTTAAAAAKAIMAAWAKAAQPNSR